MILVIGSYAMNRIQFIREPKDIDIVTDWDTMIALTKTLDLRIYPIASDHFIGFLGNERIEISLTSRETNKELLDAHKYEPTHSFKGMEVTFCKQDWLFALKMSHRYKKDSPHFLKTRDDCEILMTLTSYIPDQTWFKKREKETLAKHPKLNQSKATFFDTPGIVYKYDHDSIHRAIAIGKVPAYTLYMKDGAEVNCDKNKFFALPEEIRLNGVLEEALVLALERSQIPFNFTPDKDWSFKFALSKVCTSITSGWFREYAWYNYYKVVAKYETLPNYVETFKTKLDEGVILDYTGKSY